MKGALIILGVLVLIGAILYVLDIYYYRPRQLAAEKARLGNEPGAVDAQPDSGAENPADSEGCCGMHMVCEKTNLSPLTGEVVYYDDEELDRFSGREADSYSEEEVEEFRDILMTLLPQDVAGWSRSIQVRGITLPTEIREELLMIVSDLRAQ